MKFRKINNISGWIVFVIAYFVYLKTMEATVSFWDCGEFLSQAYKLEVGHSPGAPLFMMLGRIFSLFATNKSVIAICINSLSALTSGLTILFLFWTITHFARKIAAREEEALSTRNLIAIIGAGAVGALAYTFSDTFWFSAVEGEVYATSSFFTAFVFWAALKWEHVADKPYADRWLVLIFYMMGLSIGVHLLNLLTIPAIVMVYYFRKYTPTVKGGIIAFLTGCVILGIVQFGVIQYLPIIASKFELLFVNSFHLPFNSGAIFALLLFVAVIVLVIRWSKKNGQYFLHLATLCLAFIVIGYSSYIAYMIRSRVNVPIDVGNPDNVMSLIPYLQRDQYGSQPIVYGPDFDTHVTDIKEGGAVYAAVEKDGRDYYEVMDHKPIYTYDKERFFPRIWDFNDANHVSFYRAYLGLGKDDAPSGADNLNFFLGYQMNWMYWRYFMWNYAGRQNDMEGQGEAHNGNWISGIKFIDQMLGKGDIDKMPHSFRTNRARNQLYFLPFILGLIGAYYHFRKDRKDAAIVAVFFFFTGIAIQLYINNTPLQPRERDYSYVSTYAFAMWIGLGVMMLSDWLKRFARGPAPAVIATAVCLLAVPVLMAAQEWDDHDRSEKTLARDHAYNMLSSCDSNAILITNGDNDTYPLWYLQEVEGFRTDVRIINVNLLGTDWQNDQLLYKENDADAVPVIWKPEQFREGRLNYIMVSEDPRLSKNQYYNLTEVIRFFSDRRNMVPYGKDSVSYLPTKNLFVPIDREAVIKSGLVPAADSADIPAQMQFTFNKNNATRGDMALMNIVAGQAQTGWTRPIYLAGGTPFIGLEPYLQSEGLLNKLVPVVQKNRPGGLMPYTNLDKNLNLFLHTFRYSLAGTNRVYYDEKNRMILLLGRQEAANMALALVLNGRKADAVKVLDHFMASVSESSLPYDVLLYDNSMMMVVEAYYMADAPDKARLYAAKMEQNIRDEVKYFNSLSGSLQSGTNALIVQQNLQALGGLSQIAQRYNDAASAKKWNETLQAIAPAMFRTAPGQ